MNHVMPQLCIVAGLLCTCCQTRAADLLPTTAEEIVAAINYDSSSGDTIYLPAGTFDCSAEILLPQPGVTVIGAGKDLSILQGSLLADLEGSEETLSFADWTLDTVGRSRVTVYGPAEVH